MRRVYRSVLVCLSTLFILWSALDAAGDAGAQSDPSGDPSGGSGEILIDLTELSHEDDGSNLSWSFHTANTFDPEETLDTVQWDLDLNSNGTISESADACILLAPLFNGTGTMRASLKPSCGSVIAGTADATFVGENDVTVTFANDFFRDRTGFTGTSYQYRATSSDFNAWVDKAPSDSTFVTHSSIAQPGDTPGPTDTPAGTATPTPTGATPTPTATPTPGPNDTSATGTPSKSSLTPGEAVVLSATTGFKANASLAIVMNSTPVTLASISANATGGFSATVNIPSTATVGSHSIEVSGANNNSGVHRLTFPITVTSASTTDTSTTGTLSAGSGTGSGATLPSTGASIWIFVMVAGVLVLVGLELMGQKRRLEIWRGEE